MVDSRTTSVLPGEIGQVSLKVTVEQPTYFRLRYLTELHSSYGGSVSDVKKVGVRPRLGRPVPPTKVRARRYFTLRGSLKPHFTAGEKNVRVKAYRYRKGRWYQVKSLLAVNVDQGDFTQYRVRIKLGKKGKYRFKAATTIPGWAKATTVVSRTTVAR